MMNHIELTCPICGKKSPAGSWILHGRTTTDVCIYHDKIYSDETKTVFYGGTCPGCKMYVEFFMEIEFSPDEDFNSIYRKVKHELQDAAYQFLRDASCFSIMSRQAAGA